MCSISLLKHVVIVLAIASTFLSFLWYFYAYGGSTVGEIFNEKVVQIRGNVENLILPGGRIRNDMDSNEFSEQKIQDVKLDEKQVKSNGKTITSDDDEVPKPNMKKDQGLVTSTKTGKPELSKVTSTKDKKEQEVAGQKMSANQGQIQGLRGSLRGLPEPSDKDLQKLKQKYPNVKLKNTKVIPFSNFSYPLDIDFRKLIQDLRNGVSEIKAINVYKYKFYVNPFDVCMDDTVNMIFLIKSAPGNLVRRNAIRSTWANDALLNKLSFKRVFLTAFDKNLTLNSKIKNESEKYNDILQFSYLDNYYNNTLKTTGGIKWAAEHCGNASYVMFVDDDFYINTYKMPTLFQLVGEGNRSYAFMGHVVNSPPIRDKRSKWYISVEDYPWDKYPPFCSAGSWIITKALLHDMNAVIPYTKHYIYDDVFIAIVAHKLKVKPIVVKHFTMWMISYRLQTFKTTLTSHGYFVPSELTKAWQCTVANENSLSLPSYCFKNVNIPSKKRSFGRIN